MARLGNIGDQYFDNAGDPLIGGKLYFYESGTNTPKDTYADINLAIPNSNPVILTAAGRQPNIFFDGSARVVLTDSDDVQIEVRDPIGGAAQEGVFSPWNSLTIYDSRDIVTGSDGLFYISIQDGNQGNDPTTSPAFWTQFKLLKVWNTNETYVTNDITQGSNGLLYSAVQNSTGQDPVADLTNTYWGPISTTDVPPVIRSASKTYAFRSF